MEENRKAMRLREWLIAQIDGGKYSGLNWENKEKNLFRVPWKHAAKQDYNQHEDAALFKAWAVYKGKFREGRDRANPSAWKTRLRCALNKSCDFQEVPERSQLDISEPYKVYRIRSVGYSGAESPGKPMDVLSTQPSLPIELSSKLHQEYGSHMADGGWLPRRYTNGKLGDVSTAEPVRESAHLWSALGAPGTGSPVLFGPVQNPAALQITDFRLRVRLFYRGQLVQDVTSTGPEGCWILHGPIPAEGIHGAKLVILPSPTGVLRAPRAITMAMARLLHHLQRGVVVWSTPDGVFVKRFCQGRVYWGSPLAQHRDQPNKLEREKTCKLLDGPIFLQELERFLQGGAPEPCCQIELCFGEEFPDSGQSKANKLIMAQIEPLFARNLMTNFQRSSVEAKPPLKSLGTVTAY